MFQPAFGPGNTPLQLLPGSLWRRSIIFTVHNTVSVTIAPDGVWNGVFPPFVLNNGDELRFEYEHWGPLVTASWWAVDISAINGFTIYETFYT